MNAQSDHMVRNNVCVCAHALVGARLKYLLHLGFSGQSGERKAVIQDMRPIPGPEEITDTTPESCWLARPFGNPYFR